VITIITRNVKPKYVMSPILLLRTDESQGELRVDRFPDFPRATTTLNIMTSNFVGTVTVEATIKLDPTDADWFVLHEEVFPDFTESLDRKRNVAANYSGRFISMRAKAVKAEGFPTGLVDRVAVI
jgi:hypothetical protein